MPKEKKLNQPIPRIYKRNAESLLLFAWVKGQKEIVPTITLQQSIMSFFRYFEISVEDWDLQCAINDYSNMQHAYFDNCK